MTSDLLVKHLQQSIVFQLTLIQSTEKLSHAVIGKVPCPVSVLLQLHIRLRKRNCLRQLQILVPLRCGQIQKMLIKGSINKTFFIHICARNAVKAVSFDSHAPCQF